MSLRTLNKLSDYHRAVEDADWDMQDREAKIRITPTREDELIEKVDNLFASCVEALPRSIAYRPHGDTTSALQFLIDLELLREHAQEPHADDVIEGLRAKFKVLGFDSRHSHSVGVNTYDWLELTAPADWARRLLRPTGYLTHFSKSITKIEAA